MTQKELLYIEDAIGHEKTIIDVASETLNYLDDENLKTFLSQELEIHKNTKQRLMDTLEAKANE